MPFADPEARRRYDAARYAARREEVKARVAARRLANPEAVRQSDRNYRQRNRDAVLGRHRERYQRDRAARDAYNRAWRLAHPSARARHVRAWKTGNPLKQKEYKYRRRARLRGASVVVRFDREAIFERDGWVCGICGLPVASGEESIDHVVPVSKGGTHEPGNVRLAHRACNNKRGARV
jgi:5-methylcytosine-specific restriction endonuclease McrA